MAADDLLDTCANRVVWMGFESGSRTGVGREGGAASAAVEQWESARSANVWRAQSGFRSGLLGWWVPWTLGCSVPQIRARARRRQSRTDRRGSACTWSTVGRDLGLFWTREILQIVERAGAQRGRPLRPHQTFAYSPFGRRFVPRDKRSLLKQKPLSNRFPHSALIKL